MKLKSVFAVNANIMDPCSKLLSKLTPTCTCHAPSSRPRMRSKAVKWKKSMRLSQCRPKTKFRMRPRRNRKSAKPLLKPVPKVRVAELLTVMFSLRKTKGIEEEDDDPNPVTTDASSVGKGPFPSPITPLFASGSKRHPSKDVEEMVGGSIACKIDASEDVEETEKDVKEEVRRSDASNKIDTLEDVEEESCRSFEKYLVEMIVEEGKYKDLMDVEEILYCWRHLKNPIFIDVVRRFYGELCNDLFEPPLVQL